MSNWIYTAGRLGDHAVTMCEVKENTLIVRRVPFEVADQIELRGGYQCEDKQWGDYPLALPETGSAFLPIVLIMMLLVIASKRYSKKFGRCLTQKDFR